MRSPNRNYEKRRTKPKTIYEKQVVGKEDMRSKLQVEERERVLKKALDLVANPEKY